MARRGNRFLGSLDQLRAIVAMTGVPGAWERMPTGHWRFRCLEGAILNWWPTTKTFNFQGPAGAKVRFEHAIAVVVRDQAAAAQPQQKVLAIARKDGS